MTKQAVMTAAVTQAAHASRLSLFDQVVQGFLAELSGYKRSIQVPACLDYLDGKIELDGHCYMRRAAILAVEDLTQQIEAPQPLRREVYSVMKLLCLDPIPELRSYRDVATAILRIDATLHLSGISGTLNLAGAKPVYH
jgi:hypothetical protein